MSPSVTHKTSSPTSEVSIECSSGEGDGRPGVAAPISEAQEEASRHRAAGLAHAAPGTVGDVLAALEQAGFDEIHEQDFSSEAAQSTDRISKK